MLRRLHARGLTTATKRLYSVADTASLRCSSQVPLSHPWGARCRKLPSFLRLEELVNTAAAQTGDGRDFSDRPPCTVRSHDRVEALTCGFIELCDSPVEPRRQLAFMPDTWSECFTRFHTLRIVMYAGGVQQPGHENPTFSFMTTGRSTMSLAHRVSGVFDRDL